MFLLGKSVYLKVDEHALICHSEGNGIIDLVMYLGIDTDPTDINNTPISNYVHVSHQINQISYDMHSDKYNVESTERILLNEKDSWK